MKIFFVIIMMILVSYNDVCFCSCTDEQIKKMEKSGISISEIRDICDIREITTGMPKINFGILEEYFVISSHKKGKLKQRQGILGDITYLDGIIVNVKARGSVNNYSLMLSMFSAFYYDKDNVMIRDSFIKMTPKYPEAGWREGMPGEVFIPYLKEWDNVATILIKSVY